MGSLIINMKNEYYKKDGDVERLLKYIAGKGKNALSNKTACVSACGLKKDPCKAAKQIYKVQKKVGKDRGRRCYHLVISFPEDFDDKNVVIIVATAIADKIYQRFQNYYGIHVDTDNLHIHFAINAVSYVDGKKWHQSKKEFADFKKVILRVVNNVLKDYGYEKLRL